MMKEMRIPLFAFLLVVLSSGFFYLPDTALSAETNARTAALVEGAKKEGKLLWYSTMNIMEVAHLLSSFREKYPFISTQSYKASTEPLLIKVLTEAASNKLPCDLIMNNGPEINIMQRKGILAKYDSPERKFYPDGLKEPEGYWTDTYSTLNVVAYNTKLLSSHDAPKNYHDLLSPKWRGQMGMDGRTTVEWFAYVIKTMGDEKGLAYMKKLGDQNMKFFSNRTVVAQMIAAGEVIMSPVVYNHRIDEMKAKGAPIEWVGLEPVVGVMHPIAISASAPNPNAARLFVDFILSREGQRIIAGFYRTPTRIDVDSKLPQRKLKVAPFDPLIQDHYDKYARLFKNTLMKK